MADRSETETPKLQKNNTDVTLVVMAVADIQRPGHLEDIVNPSRTSKDLRTFRSVAWILRWWKSIENAQTLLSVEGRIFDRVIWSLNRVLIFHPSKDFGYKFM